MYVLEKPRTRFNVISYEYEPRDSRGTITMAHEGRYITLKKYGDAKKEFRYDLSTGEFERINHYKTRDDKITRTQASNITSWFTDCLLVTEDEKFAKLYVYAQSKMNTNFKSMVRFVELFAHKGIQIAEEWLSLGIKIDEIEELFNRKISGIVNYDIYVSSHKLRYSPNMYSKELIEHIKQKSTEHTISIKEINEYYEYWNDGQYKVLQQIRNKVDAKPQYQPLFMTQKYNYTTGRYEYVSIINSNKVKNLRNNIIKTIQEYNLNIDAFLEYCLYLKNVESVDIERLMGDYPDYLRRELYLKGGKMAKMEKYPKTWLTTAHKQSEEFFNIQRLERLENGSCADDFDNSIKNNKHLEWKHGHYFIRMPENAADIRDEGDQMNHCVATYIPSIEAGHKIVMFMRDKNKPEKSLVTVEVINNTITQAYAHGDTRPSAACMIWLEKWAEKNELKITASTYIE